MFHSITGTVTTLWDSLYICNDMFGIQTEYHGTQKQGTFVLFPLLDDNNKTISYFARDDPKSKAVFVKLLKISWIGPKTAFHISNLEYTSLQQATDSMDIGYFQTIPWIGPKTAKRLVIELKSVIKKDDLLKISWDDKTIKDIIKYCKTLGYDAHAVKGWLTQYTWKISKETSTEVIKWLITQL